MAKKIKISPCLEDYLETIYLIKEKRGIVKTNELAKKMDVKMPSVTESIKKLSKKGLAEYKKYGDITLTNRGEKIAKEVYKKHRVLTDFFTDVLKIRKSIAEKDACKIEHNLSPVTFRRLTEFMKSRME